MLPCASRAVLLLSVVVVAATACSRVDTPEQRVRAVIAEGERAAESRDLSALMDLVSKDYRDADGLDREELRRYLGAYLLAHPSLRLVTQVESIEFPYRDMARVRLRVGMIGRGEGTGTLPDLAADLHEIELELIDQSGEWRLRHSEHRSVLRD